MCTLTVTGLTVKDFHLLVRLKVFSTEQMNQAVFAFRRYEDASLRYTGIESHEGLTHYGLYDTVVARSERRLPYRPLLVSRTSCVHVVRDGRPATHTANVTNASPANTHNASSQEKKTHITHGRFVGLTSRAGEIESRTTPKPRQASPDDEIHE